MPPIRIAHSTTTGHTPILTLPGQVGINETDGLFFYRNASGNTVSMTLGGVTPGIIWGLTLSNNGADAVNDIDIAAGYAAEGTSPFYFMALASALTKRLDAGWAVGTNQGGLDAGGIADGTYHVWLIRRPDTGVVDALFSLSASAPTMPASYTQKRRIGAVVRGGGTILAFSQNGDEFLLAASIVDYNAAVGAAATTVSLSVPTGTKINALLRMTGVNAGTNAIVILTSPDESDQAPSGTISSIFAQAANTHAATTVNVRTNTSGQIRARALSNNTITTINTYGWIDTRGKTG